MRMRSKGFTLVEVVIALAIFGLGVTVLTQSFMGGVFSLEKFSILNRDMDGFDEAYYTILRRPTRKSIESGGELDLAVGGVVAWEAEIEDVKDLPTVFKITINLKNESSGKEETSSFFAYKYKWAEKT